MASVRDAGATSRLEHDAGLSRPGQYRLTSMKDGSPSCAAETLGNTCDYRKRDKYNPVAVTKLSRACLQTILVSLAQWPPGAGTLWALALPMWLAPSAGDVDMRWRRLVCTPYFSQTADLPPRRPAGDMQ